MTLAVRKRIQKSVKSALFFAKLVSVTVTEEIRGFYTIHVESQDKDCGSLVKTDMQATLNAWKGIYAIHAVLKEDGSPELIIRATRD